EEIELIDLREGHFLVRFYDTSDLEFALEEGPWVIFWHYLTVRRWDPAIDQTNTCFESTAVWIRFPRLSVRYYDDRVLLAMGNTVGKALKVDQNTRYASRRRFARVCVEV
ncbi:DUF4283 domain-containing protein, partial [Clostridioides difficile]|uniref:DUF4283 domain-containing protein n=1 Tax=Clostridioides difficile TaxID=1496 RepID=UPI0021143813